jgi:anti-anti-sigma factor
MSSEDEQKTCPLAHIDVAASDGLVIIKMCGLGNMNAALTIRDFIDDCLHMPCKVVMLDLDRCTGMDSTFMGTLVSVSGKLREGKAVFDICNVTDECMKLFDMLGVSQILDIENTHDFPEIEYTRIMPLPGEPKRRIQLIKHAHECLIEADERNKERFGEFIKSLNIEMCSKPACKSKSKTNK